MSADVFDMGSAEAAARKKLLALAARAVDRVHHDPAPLAEIIEDLARDLEHIRESWARLDRSKEKRISAVIARTVATIRKNVELRAIRDNAGPEGA